MKKESNAGRPPRDGAAAVGHIHIRSTIERKSAYIRAAQPKSLAEWATKILDEAAGYKSDSTRAA